MSVPVDWKILRAATDGDEASMKELAAIYLHQGVKSIQKLRAAARRQEPERLVEVAHRLLGSSRFFGATAISKPLAALLKMGRSRRLGPAAGPLVDKTEKEFIRIERFIKALPGRSADA